MKNFTIILVTMLLSVAVALSQPSNVKSVIDKYSGEEGFVSMSLNDPSPLLKDIGNDAKAKEALQTVKKMTIISFDPKKDKNIQKGKQFSNDIKNLNPSGYEELLSLNEGGNQTRMFTKIDGKSQSEFLMFVTKQSTESIIIYLSGDFNKAQISTIGKSLQKRK